MDRIAETKKQDERRGGYVDPDPRVNVWLMEGAQRDRAAAVELDPVGEQAILNGLLEACRGQYVNGVVLFMGELVAVGHSQEEAFARCLANVLRNGMYIERRLNQPSESLGVAHVD